jgi:hypothetical protein
MVKTQVSSNILPGEFYGLPCVMIDRSGDFLTAIDIRIRLCVSDEVYPQQCPCLRAFDLWSVCGIRRTRRLQTETEGAHEFTQVRPPGG